MVLRVCRNLLNNTHDAQDAFQATFLVLVQQARRLWVRDSLAPWLHRVALRVASRARASTVRRREHERRAAEQKPTLVYDEDKTEGLLEPLHKEIDRLPERYRVAVVLCDLQGLSHERAARQLGWPVGTVKSRLARARQLLRSQLTGRGFGSPTILVITEVATNSVDAEVALRMVESTLQIARLVTKAPTIGVISVRAANLAQEVLKAMFLSKLKLILAPVMLACALAIGTASVRGRQDDGFNPGPTADRPRAQRSDLARPAPEGGATGTPAFIKQSRGMIISRLELELALGKNRLDRTLRRVVSPNDPAAVQGGKTVDEIGGLLDRIDGVLFDAVDRFPTMFDFSGGQVDLGSASASPSSGKPKSVTTVMVNSVDQFEFLPFPGGAADPAQASASPSPSVPKTVGVNDVKNLSQNPQQSPNQKQPQNPDAIGESGLEAREREAIDVAGIADVDLVVSERKRVLAIGGQTTFQIRLRNYGTKDATHLVVKAKLSPNLEFVKAGGRSQDFDVKHIPQENAVMFQRIDKLGPSKEIVLGVVAKVTGRDPKLATCRASVIHDDLPDGNAFEDMAGVRVTSPRRAQ
jgi:RNA polymerase sigma factor (sigma-70 family)